MLEFISNKWNGLLESCTNNVSSAIGTGIATTGIYLEYIAMIIISIGILLWFFKYTKVFRYGCIGYLIGLLLDILGSGMIK